MNQVTRKGAFETNSSSTHSIVISGGKYVKDKLHTNEKNEIEIYPAEFGWGVDEHNDAETKLSYCLVHAMSEINKEIEGESFSEKDIEWLDFLGLQSTKIKRLIGVVASETGKSVKLMKDSCQHYPWGYIDHQSYEVCEDAFESDESLRDFIFNPKSTLLISNDNM